jgi:hypothetical protein
MSHQNTLATLPAEAPFPGRSSAPKEASMRVIRSPLVLLSALLALTVAACSSHTERTVYVPGSVAYVPPSSTVVVPSSSYYYDSYHPAYYSY